MEKNFRKFFKVSHFPLGFFLNKNNYEINHSPRVSLDSLDLDLETPMKLHENA